MTEQVHEASIDELSATSIDDELHALATPLRERLAEVERRLATAQVLVDRFRLDRDKIRKALRVVDPTFDPPVARAKSNGKGPDPKTWSERAVTKLADALAAHRVELEGKEFTSSSLARESWCPHSQSYVATLLNVLHERGVVRLVRRGGSGGAKVFQLV